MATDNLLQRAEALQMSSEELLSHLEYNRRHGQGQPMAVMMAERPAKPLGPWNTFGGFLRSVHAFGTHKRDENMLRYEQILKAVPSGMNETTGTDGGVLVPPEFANKLLMRVYDNQLLARTNMFPLKNGNTLKIPAVDETSRADGSRYGGVQGYWRGEGETVSATKGKLKLIDLTVNMLDVIVRSTDELMEDASLYTLEKYLSVVAPGELTFKIGDSLVNGVGSWQPEGMLNSPSKITVTTSTAAAAGIAALDVQNMWSRLFAQCRENAVWLIDQSLEPYLNLLTLGTGTVNLIYMPPGGMSGKPYGTLMGRPVIVTEFNAAVPTTGDIILADPTTIVSAMKGGVETATSMHVYFLSHEQAFRFSVRLDAKSWWRSPLTPKSGGPTQSNIVVLATRT